MTTRKRIEAAKGLIDSPAKWCQGFTNNGHGQRCALGAFRGRNARPLYDLLAADPSYGTRSLVEFNDTHTHAEVMALFDRALAEAA